jgi:hypothetical protein
MAVATAVGRSDAPTGTPSVSTPTAGEPNVTTPAGSEVAAAIPRSAARDAAIGGELAGGGQPNLDTTAPAARQIARQSGAVAGGPNLAGPVPTMVVAAPASATLAGGGAAAATDIGPQATVVAAAAASASGGGPISGELAAVAYSGPSGGSSGGETTGAPRFQRAEAVAGTTGAPAIGGGSGSPTRAASGPTFAASVRVETVSLAGAAMSGGADAGSLIAAQGIEAARLGGGVNAPAETGPVGALAGPSNIDVVAVGTAGDAVGARQSSPSRADGPAVGDAVNPGAPLARSTALSLPAGTTQVASVDIPDMTGDNAVDQATMEHLMGDVADTDMTRQATESGLAVNVAAREGPGGIGAEPTVDVGLNSRRALRESVQVQVREARFVRRDVGGLPNTSTAAVVAADSFRNRVPRGTGNEPSGGRGAPPPQTEEAVERGLAFLARYQLSDGSWNLRSINNEPAALVSDTAATALSLLAFQGAGYHHREHKYKDVVLNGINYLVKHQKADGDLFLPLDDQSNASVWLYSHAIATLALCEAYGMTQDPELREPAQKALNFIVSSQHPERGGWRYSPQFGSDTSVTGWMMMALKSGELSNLDVPSETYVKIKQWLDRSQASSSERHLYRYNPYAPDTETQRHGREATKTMTAVGLLMRLYSGWTRENPDMQRGADFLSQNPPTIGTARDPQRDTYYWYYATQVMFHMGGEQWQKWNAYLHPLLVNTQIKQGPMAGSWDPRGPVPDRWAPHAGRLYVTTMNLLSLEVYYRHLPLYEETAK